MPKNKTPKEGPGIMERRDRFHKDYSAPTRPDLVSFRFSRSAMNYMPGDVAGFSKEQCQAFAKQGWGETLANHEKHVKVDAAQAEAEAKAQQKQNEADRKAKLKGAAAQKALDEAKAKEEADAKAK